MKKKAMSFLIVMALALSCLGLGIQPALAADYIAAEHTASNGRPYYIMVNRAANTVTVYGLDAAGYYTVPVKAMVCSTGRSGSPTPAGNFSVTGYKRTWLHMVDGSYGQYATQFYGNYLFHSVCYTKADPSTLMTYEYNMLGGPASLGCIRLQTADAKWIFDNCAAGTKVTIYDGNSPGPLGKPDTVVSEIAPEMDNGWDPTDARENNPWRRLLVSDVRLDKTEAALAVGETDTLTAARLPSTATMPGSVSWSSSDPSVVTVDDNGKMTAVGQGTATVTAACGMGSAACTVTVSGVLVTGVSLSREEAALTAGEGFKLAAAVSPSNATVPAAPVWSSSDPSVAAVDGAGNVTPLRTGTAVITAAYGDVSAGCTVTVSGVLVTGVSLSREEAALTAGEGLRLTAAVSPSDATVPAAAVWSSSDPSVAAVDDAGNVTALRAGTAVITAAYGNASAACTVTVSGQLLPFADVAPGAWYYSDVRYACESGLFTGTGEGAFSPGKPATYAMAVQVLYRLSGAGRDGETGQEGDAWYSAAFRWAAGKGLLDGMTENSCDPGGKITRQELAALLYRYETVLCGRPADGFASLADFPDDREIYFLARDAVSWAVGNGLFQGSLTDGLRPTGYVERAQLAAVLHRYSSLQTQ